MLWLINALSIRINQPQWVSNHSINNSVFFHDKGFKRLDNLFSYRIKSYSKEKEKEKGAEPL